MSEQRTGSREDQCVVLVLSNESDCNSVVKESNVDVDINVVNMDSVF